MSEYPKTRLLAGTFLSALSLVILSLGALIVCLAGGLAWLSRDIAMLGVMAVVYALILGLGALILSTLLAVVATLMQRRSAWILCLHVPCYAFYLWVWFAYG